MVERLWRLPDDPSVGWWITGLIDGEGCFYASYSIKEKVAPGTGRTHRCFNYYVGLQVWMREDDRRVLEKIQGYFGSGIVRAKPVTENRRKQIPGSNPAVAWRIESIDDLVNVVIPHFDKFPLQGKKSNDYEAWRALVLFIHQNLHGRKGWLRRFPDRVGQVVDLIGQVKEARHYAAVSGGN